MPRQLAPTMGFALLLWFLDSQAFAQSTQQRSTFSLDGHTYEVVAGDLGGVWTLTSGEQSRQIMVPLHWRVAGTWNVETLELQDKVLATQLTLSGDKADKAFVFLGDGDLFHDPILWMGTRETLVDTLQVHIVGKQLIQTDHRAAARSCGDHFVLGSATSIYDADERAFVPVVTALEGSQIALPGLWDSKDTLDTLVSAGVHSTIAASSRADTPVTASLLNAREITDGRSDTLWTAHPDDAQPRVLLDVLNYDALTMLLILPGSLPNDLDNSLLHIFTPDSSFQISLTSELSAGFTIDLPGTPRCIGLASPPGLTIAEVIPLTLYDAQPLQEALEALLGELLSPNSPSERAYAIAQVLALQDESSLVALLRTSLEAHLPLTTELAGRATLLALNFESEAGYELLIELLLSGQLSRGDNLRAAERLRDMAPQQTGRALAVWLDTLDPLGDTYLDGAVFMATLPLKGAIKPLLAALDKSHDDLERHEEVLDLLVEVGPRIVPHVLRFVADDGMRTSTRVALLRALIRISRDWRADHLDDDFPDAQPLLTLLSHSEVSVRILSIRALGLYDVAIALPTLQTLIAQGEVDIERAEALEAVVSLGYDPLPEEVFEAFADPSPSVRIAAAEALAGSVFLNDERVLDALREVVDNETWPEARLEAYTGLIAAAHPDVTAIAWAWLLETSAKVEPALKDGALMGLASHPEALTWDTIRPLLETSERSATSRSHLVTAYLLHRGADDSMALETTRAWMKDVMNREVESAAVEVLPAALDALHQLSDPQMAPLLVEIYDSLPVVGAQGLHFKTLHLMGWYDNEDIRNRLLDALTSSEEAVVTFARESLNRLDGVQAPDSVDELVWPSDGL